MTAPVRIQLSRARGWRMPLNTKKCDRSTRFGNPFVIDANPNWETRRHAQLIAAAAPAKAVAEFDEMLVKHRRWIIPAVKHPDAYLNLPTLDDAIRELRGCNLGCWCGLCAEHKAGKPFTVSCTACAPCHCDVIGRLVNQ